MTTKIKLFKGAELAAAISLMEKTKRAWDSQSKDATGGICNALYCAEATPLDEIVGAAIRADITKALGKLTYVSFWLKARLGADGYCNPSELPEYRSAWLKSMIMNLKTNGTIFV
jgi:hypothetical protein